MSQAEVQHDLGNRQAGVPWLTDHLRLTLFPAGPYGLQDASNWFRTAAGEESESRTERRGRVLDEIGAATGSPEFRLTLHCEPPGRIDWRLLHAGPEFAFDRPGDDLDSNLESFVGAMRTWLSSAAIPPIRRLAFGAVLLSPVPNLRNGHELVLNMVPVLRLSADEDVADLLFQINRPRSSATIEELRLNRLSKWSVTTVQVLALALADGGFKMKEPEHGLAARLELDINSDARRADEIPPFRLADLFDECAQLGRDIARSGDQG